MNSAKKISMLSLALLIIGSIDSIRNMPTTALFGPQLIFFAIMGAVFFLLPVGLVSAELVTTKGLRPGIYEWVKAALGQKMAFATIWLQWINTMVWFPTILSFIAGTAAYLINPTWAQNKWYLVGIILAVFWFLTFINLKGIKVATNVAAWFTLFGMVMPVLLIVILGLVWLLGGFPLQIHFTHQQLMPHFNHAQSWISLTAIITSFLGMELAAVHAKDVENPWENFPRALILSTFFIVATTILGSLVIAWVLPQQQIHLVDGAMQVFQAFFTTYHIGWLMPIFVVALVLGSIGEMINWVISPTRGLLQAAQDQFLPKFFSKINSNGAAQNLLLMQAVLVSLMCAAFTLMPSVNGSYWLLTDLSTQLYIIVYMLLFIAAGCYKQQQLASEASFQIWGGKWGMLATCLFGLFGCSVALIIGFIPPSDINVGSATHYLLIFSSGLILMILPVFGFNYYLNRQQRLVQMSVSPL